MLDFILTSSFVAVVITAVWELIKSKVTFKHSKQLQIDNFYREISGGLLHKLFEDWSELLFFALNEDVQNKLSSEDYMSELLQRTYLYSSKETINRLVNFQQYLYSNDKKGQNHDSYVVMVLVAGVITSIKHDFTGESVSVEKVLRIKLMDIDEHYDTVRRAMDHYDYK